MNCPFKFSYIHTDFQSSHSNCSSNNISQTHLLNISIQKDARWTGGLTSVWATEMCELFWDRGRLSRAAATRCFYTARWFLLILSDKACTCTTHSFFLLLTPLCEHLGVCTCCFSIFICHIFCSFLHPVSPFYLWYKSIKKSCFFSISFPLLCPLCASAAVTPVSCISIKD